MFFAQIEKTEETIDERWLQKTADFRLEYNIISLKKIPNRHKIPDPFFHSQLKTAVKLLSTAFHFL